MDRAWLSSARLPADLIKGGTAISGLFDLAPVAASFQNEALGLTAGEVDRFSPLRRRPEIGAPLIVAVGGDETDEFLDQSARFAAQARRLGADVEHLVVPGTNHITVILDALADPAAPLNRAVRHQMDLLKE
jgi:arylformamidase